MAIVHWPRWLVLLVCVALGAQVLAQSPAPVLLVVGDSISAGYGLAKGEGWVDLLAARLAKEGYRERGLSEDESERRAWATVNKVHGGGEKPGGGGYGKPENHEPMRKGGKTAKKR